MSSKNKTRVVLLSNLICKQTFIIYSADILTGKSAEEWKAYKHSF